MFVEVYPLLIRLSIIIEYEKLSENEARVFVLSNVVVE
jgi:hypothetical protein